MARSTEEDNLDSVVYSFTPTYDYALLKNDMGNFRTKTLFLETCENLAKDKPLFTLKDRDHRGFICIKKVFMGYKDPTEYAFAMAVFNSWDHWKKLQNNKNLTCHFNSWREELEIALRSEGIRTLRNMTSRNDSTGYNAAKFLAEKGWEKDARGKRKTVKDKDRDSRIVAEAIKSIDDDLARIMA